MKKYKILKKEYSQAPNGDLMMSNHLILAGELSCEALGIFMAMALMECTGEELTDINIQTKGREPLEELYPIFQELIDIGYIEEI